jgi:hypothetical protein
MAQSAEANFGGGLPIFGSFPLSWEKKRNEIEL